MASELGPTIPTQAAQKAEASQEHGERARLRNHGDLDIVHKQRFGTSSHTVTVADHANPKSKCGAARIKTSTKSAQIIRKVLVSRPRKWSLSRS